MLTEERRNEIVAYIEKHNAATVQELVDALNASAATIRRDLSVLHDERRIIKVFGGATSLKSKDVNTVEPSVAEKSSRNTQEKDLISEYAASLIQDNDFVYIDSGTTTLHLIDHITNKNAKYITNGIVHAKRMLERGLSTMIIGGRIKPVTEAVIGPDCVEALSRFHFTKSFMGTNGISVPAGFTTPDVDEALVKAEAIKHTYLSYVLADHTKFGVVSSVTFSDLRSCCIITDTTPSKKYSDQTIIKAVIQK
ncbi:DeoR/GlpR family DNA-binding transcription regulator [Butyrivibrio sp. WCD3002]|jgi:DeoR family fructose operon transcriptional repressor|uniref:DeoR/GlpR family DNA-binding transcription regulator n=1 Tax=Butyrivibrio sp. WCD3002 TaxID=1280676 RepID=UPI000402FECF|nr:DeoR/GlpR family DNA-binding transcription regulator [Butyrivibrio sp. WCD3002]